MRVVQIAAPRFQIPPTGYGSIERVVADLTEALIDAGCEVVLCAPEESRIRARLIPTVSRPLGLAMTEATKSWLLAEASREAYRAALTLGADLIHDHTAPLLPPGFPIPIVHTVHGPATGEAVNTCRRMSRRGHFLVAISRRQCDLFSAVPANVGAPETT